MPLIRVASLYLAGGFGQTDLPRCQSSPPSYNSYHTGAWRVIWRPGPTVKSPSVSGLSLSLSSLFSQIEMLRNRVLGLGCSGYRDRTRSQVTLLMRASTQASTQNRRIVFARSSPFRGAGQLQLQENEQLPVIGCASQFDMF